MLTRLPAPPWRYPAQRGMALATVAIVLLLLGALAFAGVRMLVDHRLIISSQVQREQALRAAEYALAQAEQEAASAPQSTLRDGMVTGGRCGTGAQRGYCAAEPLGAPGWTFARFRERGTAANTRAAGTAQNAPRYVLELLPDQHPGLAMHLPGTYGAEPAILYRITAAGFGNDGDIPRMLQTLVRPVARAP